MLFEHFVSSARPSAPVLRPDPDAAEALLVYDWQATGSERTTRRRWEYRVTRAYRHRTGTVRLEGTIRLWEGDELISEAERFTPATLDQNHERFVAQKGLVASPGECGEATGVVVESETRAPLRELPSA